MYRLLRSEDVTEKDSCKSNLQGSIGVQTFCKAFPFHILFDSRMELKQIGLALLRAMNNQCSFRASFSNCQTSEKLVHFSEVFTMQSPLCCTNGALDAEKILSCTKELFYISTNHSNVLQETWKVG